MPRNTLRAGYGAECSVLIKYLHPSRLIQDKIINRREIDRLEGLVAQTKEIRKVNHRDQIVVVFKHDELFPGDEIYCVARFCKVLKEGDASGYFDDGNAAPPQNEPVNPSTPTDYNSLEDREEHAARTNDGIDLPSTLPASGGRATSEDVAMMRGMGFEVDDDNDPLPENIPTSAPTETPTRRNDNNNNVTPPATPPAHDNDDDDELFEGQSWGWSGVCERRSTGSGTKFKATLLGASLWTIFHGMTFMKMFMKMFPELFIRLQLREMNKLPAFAGNPLTYGEFLRFIGLMLLICTTTGHDRRAFWSSLPVNNFSGAPMRLNNLMSLKRFESIISNLVYTDEDPPTYRDKFWEVRQMIKMWNCNMNENFAASWVCCLDESMSIWLNRWTCPGWIWCPRKPHPFGNEYHDICCGESGIIFRILLREGKDRPRERDNHPDERAYATYSSTAKLLMYLCSTIYHSGRVLILDSGFCVLEALLLLRSFGIFASALIKKRRYWPSLVKGDAIEERMRSKRLGETDAISGQNEEGTKYNIFCMKDSLFVMKMMSTYGTLNEPVGQEETYRQLPDGSKEYFKYSEVFANHYKYRHIIDDGNNLRHKVPSIEGSWITHRWATRVFTFLLALAEVNAFLAYRYFIWETPIHDTKKEPKLTLIEFRRKLAQQLIHNEYLQQEQAEMNLDSADLDELRKSKRLNVQTHDLLTCPLHARKFVPTQGWDCSAKQPHQQHVCRTNGCKRKVRTSCSCNEGHWMCTQCHRNHYKNVVIEELRGD